MRKLQLLKKKIGWTLIELMMTSALLGMLGYGTLIMFRDGIKLWHNSSARLALYSEARLTMLLLTKFVHNCQGSTIRISRYNNNQPAQSFISGILIEPLYVKTTTGYCCGSGSDVITVGSANNPNKNHTRIYQEGNKLIIAYPYLEPGTDIKDKDEVDAHTYYKYITVSTNLESLIITYDDSRSDKIILISARFVKPGFQDQLQRINLKQAAAVKRMHSSGYYAN